VILPGYSGDIGAISTRCGEEIGDGGYVREGSPAKNADKIKVPVLRNELLTWDFLATQLTESDARTQMLRKSEEVAALVGVAENNAWRMFPSASGAGQTAFIGAC